MKKIFKIIIFVLVTFLIFGIVNTFVKNLTGQDTLYSFVSELFGSISSSDDSPLKDNTESKAPDDTSFGDTTTSDQEPDETEPLECDNHSWNPSVTEISATCTSEGLEVATCKVCGYSLRVTLSKLPHRYSEWISISDTQHYRYCSYGCGVTSYGIHDGFACGLCGFIGEVPEITCNHNYEGPTGTGVYTPIDEYSHEELCTMTCLYCGDTFTIYDGSDSHTFGAGSNTSHGVCSLCGYEITEHFYECLDQSYISNGPYEHIIDSYYYCECGESFTDRSYYDHDFYNGFCVCGEKQEYFDPDRPCPSEENHGEKYIVTSCTLIPQVEWHYYQWDLKYYCEDCDYSYTSVECPEFCAGLSSCNH